MAKANAAHLLDGAQAEAGPKKRSVATKTAQRKKVAAAKASKAASARAAMTTVRAPPPARPR